jgi:hypothetical protein
VNKFISRRCGRLAVTLAALFALGTVCAQTAPAPSTRSRCPKVPREPFE